MGTVCGSRVMPPTSVGISASTSTGPEGVGAVVGAEEVAATVGASVGVDAAVEVAAALGAAVAPVGVATALWPGVAEV